MASAGFAVIGGAPRLEIEPFGLLDGLPEPVLATARDWGRQVPRPAGTRILRSHWDEAA